MKLKIFCMLLFCSVFAHAQNTLNIVGTVTDTSSTNWGNATWTARIVIPGGGGQAQYKSGGAVPNLWTGTLTSGGAFQGTNNIGNTQQMVPLGVNYTVCIQPLATAAAQCFQNVTTSPSGSNWNYNPVPVALQIQSGVIKYSYNATEIINPNTGDSYYNSITGCGFLYNGSWNALPCSGGGSGIGFPFYSNNFPIVNPPDTYVPAFGECTQTLLPSDPGNPYGGSNCLSLQYNDWYPGRDYGSPGNYPTDDYGWYGPYAINLNVDSKSAGIHSAEVLTGAYTGPGDINFSNRLAQVRPATIDGSGEGYHLERNDTEEMREYAATIVTGGTGSNILTLTCTSNCPGLNTNLNQWQGGSMGLQSPLIDNTSSTAVTLSGATSAGYSGAIVATTNITVPVSTTGTLAATVNAPQLVPNNTLKLSATIATVLLNTTTNLSISPGLITILSHSDGEPNFIETVKPTAYGTFTGTQQTITATFYFSHIAGTKFFAGGMAGQYFENTQTAATGVFQQHYVEYVFGSPTANTVWIGHQVQDGISSIGTNLYGAGHFYKGADIVGVVNPASVSGCGSTTSGAPITPPCAAPDGTYLVVEANNTFANGDTVTNTNAIWGNYDVKYNIANIFNPYAGVRHTLNIIGSLEGALNDSFGGIQDATINQVPSSNYNGAGGTYIAPRAFYYEGAFSTFYAAQYYPLPSTFSGGLQAPNCGGSILCSANGPAPGATSTITAIWKAGDSGDAFTIDHASNTFNIQSTNFTFNGTEIATTSTPVTNFTGTWYPTASHTPGYGCVLLNPSALCTDGTTNNNYFQWGWVMEVQANNQWLGGQYGTEAAIKITAETPNTPGYVGSINMYGYGDTTDAGGNAFGQIWIHGLNSGTNGAILFDRGGGSGHGGNIGVGYNPGSAIIDNFDVAGGINAGTHYAINENQGAAGQCIASLGGGTGSAWLACNLSTYFQNEGYSNTSTTTPGLSSNGTYCAGLGLPNTLSVGHMQIAINNADVFASDVGYYDSAGTLHHIGAQILAGGIRSYALVGGTQTIASGKGYLCVTDSNPSPTLQLNVFQQGQTYFNFASLAISTTGGALNSTIIPPGDNPAVGNYSGSAIVPTVIFMP